MPGFKRTGQHVLIVLRTVNSLTDANLTDFVTKLVLLLVLIPVLITGICTIVYTDADTYTFTLMLTRRHASNLALSIIHTPPVCSPPLQVISGPSPFAPPAPCRRTYPGPTTPRPVCRCRRSRARSNGSSRCSGPRWESKSHADTCCSAAIAAAAAADQPIVATEGGLDHLWR